MTRDRQLLDQAESSLTPLTVIRFYQWDTPTVSLGHNQNAEKAIDSKYCQDQKIPIVHRPTGGRAVLHSEELTYAVISNDLSLFGDSIRDGYLRIGHALKTGIARIGIHSKLAKGVKKTALTFREGNKKPCFISPSRAELLVNNRKIAGSAQRRLKRAFLQHGSIPLEVDYFEMGRVLCIAPSQLQDNMISVSEAAGRSVPFDELAEALKEGFMVSTKKWTDGRS